MILVDSDVLIAHLRGVPAARDWLHAAREAGPLSVSAVSIAEVLGGVRPNEEHAVNALLGALATHPVTESVARRAGALRREFARSHTGIGLGDYLIAGTALNLGLDLATLNTRHFPMFPGLRAPFALPARS